MKILSPKAHGVIDYLFDALFVLAPSIFGFTDLTASNLCYVLAAGHFAMNVLTDYPLGAVQAISFRAHGNIEAIISLVILLAPWIGGFNLTDLAARNYFVVAGVLLLGVWSITDYRRESVVREQRTSDK